MRLVTWNCCRGPFEAKAEALAPLKPDIAILQEAPRPKAKDAPQRLWFGGAARVGIAVLAFNGYTVACASRPASDTDPVRAVRVGGRADFNLLAIWARADTKYIRGVYDRMLGHVRLARQRPTILAGDLNSNTIWDRPRVPMNHTRFVAWLRRAGPGERLPRALQRGARPGVPADLLLPMESAEALPHRLLLRARGIATENSRRRGRRVRGVEEAERSQAGDGGGRDVVGASSGLPGRNGPCGPPSLLALATKPQSIAEASSQRSVRRRIRDRRRPRIQNPESTRRPRHAGSRSCRRLQRRDEGAQPDSPSKSRTISERFRVPTHQ